MAEQRGGRPIAASMRPTGGDKALVSRKQYFRRKKVCKFSVEKMKQFISENGRILPRRITGTSPAFQRRLARAIKQARNIALLPFTSRN
jgi:small subunit ribosomal protein S18